MVGEVLKYLGRGGGGESGRLYFDGTVGGGGHAEALLTSNPEARVIAVDRDPEAVAAARERLSRFGSRATVRESDFVAAAESLREPVAAALLDLGVSSQQIDEARRGFSFRPGTPLDMRMRAARGTQTAADLLNTLSESELTRIFREYGEEGRASRLARQIVRQRAEAPLRTSDDLLEAVHRSLGGRVSMRGRARLFQALRIAVNNELEQLDRGLPILRDRLEPEGVLVVLSYHSLEDRAVKTAFREWSLSCVCPPELPVCQCRGHALGEVQTRRVVRPSPEEVEANPRARSARLRAWKKAA
jgi:16S rRNA (cytosine1402-N4)-methyltransferase